jgi:hypothetical protein
MNIHIRKLIRFYFTISLLLLSKLAFGNNTLDLATLSGYIRDAETGEELIGANVVIEKLNTGATTNAYGFYSVSLPFGKYVVTYSYIGYETIEKVIDLSDSKAINIEMKTAYLESEAIVTTAEKVDENVKSIEMSVSKIDVKSIRKVPVVLGEADVLKTMTLLPGVSTIGEGASGFNVRGGAADQNLILLDESPIFNAAHLFGFFSVFNSDAMKDVKLYKGGIPANYGGRLSSVLDVRQREGNSKAFKASGGLGLISSRLLIEGPLQQDKSSFLIAGRRSYGDLFLPLFNNNSVAYFYDLNFKANYILSDNNRLFASGYLGRDRFELDKVFGNEWGNSAVTLRWNHLFSNQIFSNFSAIYSKYDYGLSILADGSGFEWNAQIRNMNLKTDLSYFINDRNTIDFGAGAIMYKFEPGQIDPTDNSAVVSQTLDKKYALEPAVYLNYDQKISSNLSMQYGLRYSTFYRMGKQTIYSYENNAPVVYNDFLKRYDDGVITDSTSYGQNEIIKSFSGFEPRISARYSFNTSSSIKMSYNRTRQYIHLVTNNTSPSPLDVWSPSGKYIKPQIADQYAIGYFRNFVDNTYESSVEIYYKKLYNQLDYVPGADLLLNNTLETEILYGQGRSYGLELFLKKNTGRLTGWISYTLARAENQVKGLTPLDPGINNGKYYPSNFDKTHDLSITGIYEANLTWSFGANFIYTSGRPITYPKSRYEYGDIVVTQYEDRNSDRLPAYHRIDISATLHNKWRGDWVFSLYNVYNRQNASSITFRQNEDNPTITEAVRTTIFGIIPSITYNFNF